MSEDKRALEIVEDSELGGRRPLGLDRWIIAAVAISWSLFQLWATWSGTMDPIKLRAIHLAFALALAFLVYPYSRKSPRDRVPWADWLLAVLGAGGALYVVAEYYNITQIRGGLPNQLDTLMGSLLLLVLIAACFRVLGRALPIIASAFLLYAMIGPKGIFHISLPSWLQLHAGYSWPQAVGQLYLTSEGIWGTPIGVSATFVFLFVLFGALLDKAGAGHFLIQLAYSLLGTFRGGPAKAAVVASGLHGMVSGSSVSNVVTVGTLTIPLMKRVGYPAETAGAIEVASGSNGQLMPPVMGAAAFIMAQYLSIPYNQLIVYAALPALLAYATLFMVVHLEALRLGLKGVPRAELPSSVKVLRGGFHYLIPLGYLIYSLVIVHRTPERAAFNTVVLVAVLILLQEAWRAARGGSGLLSGLKDGLIKIVEGLEAAGRGMVGIALATASAGIIVGMVLITNLGYGLAQIVEALSGGNILVVLLLAQIISLVLGMGVPTTANYILMANLVVPVVLNIADPEGANQTIKIATHMFVFYFGIMADSTPPVALAAYAASAIAKSDFWKTGVQGFVYELRTAFLAYMFFFNPALLLLGVKSFGQGLEVAVTALFGMLAFAAGTMGFLHKRTNLLQRLMLLGAALALVVPGVETDILGAFLLLAVYLWQKLVSSRLTPAA
ncbi:MAG: TRAP transporter permease [Deinococcus sp.]|nr:TRAP transporter permease [Deinococcus sp.]